MEIKNKWIQKILPALRAPGNGVHTVHTGQEKKNILFKKIYGSIKPDIVQKKWQESLLKNDFSLKPLLLAIPSDSGAGIIKGSNWGPLFIRESLIDQSSKRYTDLGDVLCIPQLLMDDYLNETTIASCQKAVYGKKNNLPVSCLSIADYFLQNLYQKNPQAKLIGLGGDHSVSYPFVKNWIQNQKDPHFAVIHFDAHTDLLSERLGIPICFGSWAYHILKFLPAPKHLIQIGIRSSGKNKKYWEQNLGIKQIWAPEIKKKGVEKTSQEIIKSLHKLNVKNIYISFDIDALDSLFASATGTPENEGIALHEALILIHDLCHHFKLTGCDLVEVAPYISHGSHSTHEPWQTLQSSKAIIESFLDGFNQ